MGTTNSHDKSSLDNHMAGILTDSALYINHREIPNKLLAQCKEVNFEAKILEVKDALENNSNSKYTKAEIDKQLAFIKQGQQHYYVMIAEEIFRIADDNNYGICKHLNQIYLFNGAFWAPIDKDTFQRFLGEAALNMGIIRFKAKLFHFKENLCKQFYSDAHTPILTANNNEVLINLQNGTYAITPQGSSLRPFNKDEMLTYQLSFKFDKNAKATRFQEYLDRVLPDKSKQLVLAEYIGYLFVRNGSATLKEEKVLLLYGVGANGKSVFFEIVNALLGKENVSNNSLKNLTNENGYYRASLASKLLNYASEICGKMETNIFKQMVSGEPIDARLPYGEPFIITQYAKMIFNCNELPKDIERTNAFFRRFLIIHFAETIPPHEQDKELHTKIIDNELAGVFNWALEGLNRLLKQKGFSKCEAIELAREEYKIQSDSILTFLLDENYKPSTTKSKPLKELYQEYSNFCHDNGYRRCGNKQFSKRLISENYVNSRNALGTIFFIEKINF